MNLKCFKIHSISTLNQVVKRIRTLSLEDKKKIRYISIGIWNTVFSYAAFVLLYFYTHNYLHYMLVLVMSQIVGLTNAYVGYKLLVFKTKGNFIGEYLRFCVVYGSTFLVNLVLIAFFVELLGINPILSQGVIAVIVATMAYFGHSRFSFNSK